jgi:hypothetical protein
MRFFRDQTPRRWFVKGNTAQYHRPSDYFTALENEHSYLTPRFFNGEEKPLFSITIP